VTDVVAAVHFVGASSAAGVLCNTADADVETAVVTLPSSYYASVPIDTSYFAAAAAAAAAFDLVLPVTIPFLEPLCTDVYSGLNIDCQDP